jgi:hypothetical protein
MLNGETILSFFCRQLSAGGKPGLQRSFFKLRNWRNMLMAVERRRRKEKKKKGKRCATLSSPSSSHATLPYAHYSCQGRQTTQRVCHVGVPFRTLPAVLASEEGRKKVLSAVLFVFTIFLAHGTLSPTLCASFTTLHSSEASVITLTILAFHRHSPWRVSPAFTATDEPRGRDDKTVPKKNRKGGQASVCVCVCEREREREKTRERDSRTLRPLKEQRRKEVKTKGK